MRCTKCKEWDRKRTNRCPAPGDVREIEVKVPVSTLRPVESFIFCRETRLVPSRLSVSPACTTVGSRLDDEPDYEGYDVVIMGIIDHAPRDVRWHGVSIIHADDYIPGRCSPLRADNDAGSTIMLVASGLELACVGDDAIFPLCINRIVPPTVNVHGKHARTTTTGRTSERLQQSRLKARQPCLVETYRILL